MIHGVIITLISKYVGDIFEDSKKHVEGGICLRWIHRVIVTLI